MVSKTELSLIKYGFGGMMDLRPVPLRSDYGLH